MRYGHAFLLTYASFALLVGAAPQDDAAAAGTSAVTKSTKTQTKVATATIGDADPAAATGEGGADAESVQAVTGDTTDQTSLGGDAAGGSTGDVSGGEGASDISSGNADNGMLPDGSGSGTGTGDLSGGGNGPPGGKGGSHGEDCEKEGGKGSGGERGYLWSKFLAGSGHPHQPVARGWSDWFSGGGGAKVGHEGRYGKENEMQQHARRMGGGDGGYGWKGAHGGEQGGRHHRVAARDMPSGGHGARIGGGHRGSHTFQARDNILQSGPSWNHVRNGGVASVKVARGLFMGGEGADRRRRGGHGRL